MKDSKKKIKYTQLFTLNSLLWLTLLATSCRVLNTIRTSKDNEQHPPKKTVTTKKETNQTSMVKVPLKSVDNIDELLQLQTTPKKESRSIRIDGVHTQVKTNKRLSKYCKLVNKKFKKYRWGKSHCKYITWNHVRNSVQDRPLIWTVFGDEKKSKKSHLDTTLVLCGVHGDEITPIKFCFDIIEHLSHNHHSLYQNKLIAVAPIVNPDSFFTRRPSRVNARGVDINRNFPTKDWNARALKLWKHRYRSDKRRYPGKRPLSEPEVLFQMNLIKRYKPDKIISVHAPLTMLDYDGPDLNDKGSKLKKGILANQLLITMSEKAKKYRIKNYPFFPGSLGNWAGKERRIPTYTLELPTSDPHKSKAYWDLFKEAIHLAFSHSFSGQKEVAN